MSGSIGANRILREHVAPTVEKYEKEVLQKFPGYKKCEITGSYNAGTKADHGDIDLCVWIDSSDDIKNVKKAFKQHVEDLPDELTPTFRAGRNQGKKAQLYGSIVTCQIGIVGGKEGETVQIDNIIVLKPEELNFQKTFLNMNAQLQTLYTALVRVAPDDVKEAAFKQYGIAELPVLDTNQEFEFVLSSAGFSLRKVTLTDERKQKAKEEIWRSVVWDDVEWLITKSLGQKVQGKDYEEVLEITSKAYEKDERARKRICGVMKSMINIGPGEVGTPKGEAKEKGIKLAYQKLNVQESKTMKSLTQFLNESLEVEINKYGDSPAEAAWKKMISKGSTRNINNFIKVAKTDEEIRDDGGNFLLSLVRDYNRNPEVAIYTYDKGSIWVFRFNDQGASYMTYKKERSFIDDIINTNPDKAFYISNKIGYTWTTKLRDISE